MSFKLGWLGGIVVRTLDLQLSVVGSISSYDTTGYFCDSWPYFAGKLSLEITTTEANSALHPSGVAKLSTSFGQGKGGVAGNTVWSHVVRDFP